MPPSFFRHQVNFLFLAKNLRVSFTPQPEKSPQHGGTEPRLKTDGEASLADTASLAGARSPTCSWMSTFNYHAGGSNTVLPRGCTSEKSQFRAASTLAWSLHPQHTLSPPPPDPWHLTRNGLSTEPAGPISTPPSHLLLPSPRPSTVVSQFLADGISGKNHHPTWLLSTKPQTCRPSQYGV